jgi:flagellar assembly factor FliW
MMGAGIRDEDEASRASRVGMVGMDTAEDLPVVHLPEGIPGFPHLRRFALTDLDPTGLLKELASLDDRTVRFVVVPSVAFYPDYAPVIDDGTARLLGLDGSDTGQDPLVLLVVTVGATLDTSTVNLLAPVVINGSTRVAAQVVLEDTTLPLRAPLTP